jgi:hypothetical protein
MQLTTRLLDLVAALILEVTAVYVDAKFGDILSADARFLLFVLVTANALWRMAGVLETVKSPIGLSARKAWRNLDLTLSRENVFSGFCIRKDG